MHNKEICKTCVYSMILSGGKSYTKAMRERPEDNLMCARSILIHNTCLQMVHGEVVDARGDDADNCALFKAKQAPRLNGGWH